MTQHGFFVDLSRCIGCNTCTIACKQWHDIEPGPCKPMRVYQWETDRYPRLGLHMLPVMCYHCEHPACLDACKNEAIYKEEKYGAVIVDPDKCRGDRNCWQACPYGTPQFAGDDPGTGMRKCDMCIERLEQGLQPICVLSCSMRALEFGPWEQIVRKYGNPRRIGAAPGYSPCRLTCPAGFEAEEYVRHIAEGRIEEALEWFRAFSPFAGVLGRVCTHPCESECQRGMVDKPLALKALKRFVADAELSRGAEYQGPCAVTQEGRVAVVGSGPAGLSCAYDLVRMGYPVTVFEAAPRSGGMLRYGIPGYRLPRDVLDYEIGYMEALGVEVRTSRRIEKTADLIDAGYSAVFIAAGAWLPRPLAGIDATLDSVRNAVDFLREVNSGKKVKVGRKVVVIGGGSVAIDAARVASRLGAFEVHVVCLESRNLASAERMPAEDEEIIEAEEEGIIIDSSLGVKRVLVDGGKARGVETVPCVSVFNEEGIFAPGFAEGPVRTIDGDTVIVAIGQRPDPASFPEVQKNPAGEIRVDPLTLETSLDGVFAGGDAVTGAGQVVSAVAAGKRAAVSIARYLMGEDQKTGRTLPTSLVPAKYPKRAGLRQSRLPLEGRKGFREVSMPMREEDAVEEAERCFHCGTTMPCVVFKPVDAKEAVIRWDPLKALRLWQKRQPGEDGSLPDVFREISEITNARTDIVGRNRLVLKTKNSEELLYYTTDNE